MQCTRVTIVNLHCARVRKKGSDPLPSLSLIRYFKGFERVRPLFPNPIAKDLCQDTLHDLAVDVSQAHVAAAVTIG